ncbi:hypothetical protein HPP92_028289 [Vanilla planifolia]|uniref:Uncharacterized protein n=1 Tax=Vanilla planifolia TaxID=51239 RepID=A0A835P5U5_VANPL|nr:hypothetical protein HPP92_028289 [Vanilla planifolia]KAG0447592.1 hypothetical protein HPP92_028271 [Vanilla planifolia]
MTRPREHISSPSAGSQTPKPVRELNHGAQLRRLYPVFIQCPLATAAIMDGKRSKDLTSTPVISVERCLREVDNDKEAETESDDDAMIGLTLPLPPLPGYFLMMSFNRIWMTCPWKKVRILSNEIVLKGHSRQLNPEGHQVRAQVGVPPDRFLCVTGSAQAKVIKPKLARPLRIPVTV